MNCIKHLLPELCSVLTTHELSCSVQVSLGAGALLFTLSYPYTFNSQGDAVEDGHHNTGRVSPFSDPADWYLILFTPFYLRYSFFFSSFSCFPQNRLLEMSTHVPPQSLASKTLALHLFPSANTQHISPATGAALHPTNSASIQHQTGVFVFFFPARVEC